MADKFLLLHRGRYNKPGGRFEIVEGWDNVENIIKAILDRSDAILADVPQVLRVNHATKPDIIAAVIDISDMCRRYRNGTLELPRQFLNEPDVP